MEEHWRTRFATLSPLFCSFTWLLSAQIALSHMLNPSSLAKSVEERTNPRSEEAAQRLAYCSTTLRHSFLHKTFPVAFCNLSSPYLLSFHPHNPSRSSFSGLIPMTISSADQPILFSNLARTFQLAPIPAIVAGLGRGKALFGRYSLQIGHRH
jgi:hypothetical protein